MYSTSPAPKIWSVGTLTYTTAGLASLFGWLLWGDFAWQMRDRAVPLVMQLMFKKYDASDMMLGVLMGSLPLAIGLLSGPFISYLSDRHRGRWGRRIPYLIFTTPFIFASIVGLAFSPTMGQGLSALLGVTILGLHPAILLCMAIFWMVFEFTCGVANMIFGGLVNDVVPQVVIGRFFALFRVVSLVAGIIFNHWLFGKAEAHYTLIFISVGLIYVAGFSMLCLKVKEGQYPPVPPATPNQANWFSRLWAAIKIYFKDGYSHSYYLWYFVASILAGLSTSPANLYNIYYAQSLGIDAQGYGDYLSISFVFSLLLAYPLGMLVDRFHPLRLTIGTLTLYMLVMLWSFFYATKPSLMGITLVIQSVLAGSFYTVSFSLPQRLLPRDKFAQIGSAGGTVGCIVGIGFAPLLGIFLDHIHHQYRYTYYIGFVITALAVLTNIVLYRKFMALGGPDHYEAPANRYETA